MTQTPQYYPLDDVVQSQRQQMAIWLVSGAVILSVFAAFGYGIFTLVKRPLIAPAPITYHQTTILPERPGLCPRLTLTFTVASTVNAPDGYIPGTPIGFTVTRSYWDVTHNRQAVTRNNSLVPVLTETRSVPGPGEYSATKRFYLPDLAPAEYKLLTIVQTGATLGAGYNVPFTIRDDCQP